MDPAREIVAREGLRGLTRAEYHQLVDLGLFEQDRVELLHGVVVPMSPMSPRHAATVSRLAKILTLAVLDEAEVRSHSPFAASDDSEPEPDVAVVPIGAWDDDHPGVAHLLVEVAQSSLARDRGPKLAMYAAAGVPEYWIVDLAARAIEVHRDPAGDRYRSLQTFAEGDRITLLGLPQITVPVKAIVAGSVGPLSRS